MTKRGRLAQFGAEVLAILEEQDEWSADTLDDIANAAVNLDLAQADQYSMFEQTEEHHA